MRGVMIEVWMPAAGYEGRLEVSDLGNIRSVARDVEVTRGGTTYLQSHKAEDFTPFPFRGGYLAITIRKGGRQVRIMVHRLVAATFVPCHEPGLTVDHVNGQITDNRACNLAWVTRAENARLAWQRGHNQARGERHPAAKLTAQQVCHVRRLLEVGASCKSIAVVAGVWPGTIYQIKYGNRWKSLADTDEEPPLCQPA